MDTNEIISAIGGPVQLPAKPDGDPNPQVLSPLGLDRQGAEPFPPAVEAQQGAGSGAVLTPGAQGQAADGTVQPATNDNYSSPGGPDLLVPSSGLSALTPDPSHGRPEGGGVTMAETEGAARDPRLGGDQTGQLLNPALHWEKPGK
jgi:hypothetical protein